MRRISRSISLVIAVLLLALSVDFLVEAVRKNEPGNHLYVLCKGSEPQTYYFLERYENEEALAAHGGSAHMKEHGGAMGPHMAGRPEILRLHVPASRPRH